jgi:G3E family GTPase
VIHEPSARRPVVVLTGFLGSGKTTLLRSALVDPRFSRSVVFINEFGEIGLDHLLVKEVHGSTIVLENGCICCQLQGDLRQSLRSLIDEGAQHRAGPDFDRIIVETTGLADPAPVLRVLTLDPMLRHQLRLDLCVTTVDAVNGLRQLQEFPVFADQVAAADRVVVTKGDLADLERVEQLADRLSSLNPAAALTFSQDSAFDAAGLLAGGAAEHGAQPASRRGRVATEAGESETGAATDVQSFSLRISAQVDWAAFGVWLSALQHKHDSNVLRVKALLFTRDAPGPIVVHAVQNIVHAPSHLAAWPDPDRRSRIVFILRGLEPERVRRSLLKFLSACQGNAMEIERL